MAGGVSVQVIRDDATPRLKQLVSDFGSRPFFGALGKRLETELQKHFKEKGQVPNKRGWPSQHFWDRRIRNATSLTSFTDREATVTVADPAFAVRVYGGTIRPKEKKFLAIPLLAAAAGKQPSSGLIKGLFVERWSDGSLFLAQKSGEGKEAGLIYFYRLVRQVTVPKDPTALPPEEKVHSALVDEAEKFAARRLQA